MRTIFILCAGLLGLLTIPAMAQTYTFGTGFAANSGTFYPAPYGNFYWGAKTQMIIHASELTAAGASAGAINSLAFNVFAVNSGIGSCGSPQPLIDFEIKMKLTTTGAASTILETGATSVWGPQTHQDTLGWNVHNFHTPFYWDGVSNLLIETCFNNTCFSGNAEMYYTPTTFISSVTLFQDATGVCSGTSAFNTSLNRPDMQLAFGTWTDPPISKFEADPVKNCNGTVNFTDLSIGPVDSWLWDFGDGNTDTLEDPTHVYATPGVYTVSLITTNTNGSDTLEIQDFIEVVAPFTIPYSQDFNGGLFTLNDFIVDTRRESDLLISGDGANGQGFGMVMGGNTFASWITPIPGQEFFSNFDHLATATLCVDATGFSSLGLIFDLKILYYVDDRFTNFRVTVDGNQIGNIYQSNGVTGDWETIYMDLSAYVGSFLEVSFESNCRYAYNDGGLDMGNGVYVDNILIKEINDPPVAAFVASDTLECTGSLTVDFTDKSGFFPDTWQWDFGDGNTSSLQHPTHTYLNPGLYTVTLTVTNAFGQDVIVKTDHIEVTNASPKAANCIPTNNYFNEAGIYQVQIDTTFLHNTENGIEGYQDYTCTQVATITAGVPTPIKVVTGPNYEEYVKVWIDLNDDGILDDPGELVFDSDPQLITHTGTLLIPQNVTYNTLLRMRVKTDWAFGLPPDPCNGITTGQTEDYSVIIEENMFPPEVVFTGAPILTCSGTVNFQDQSFNFPTSWDWDFGDGTTSTLQDPTHTYTYLDTGVYTIQLIACNPYGCDTATYDQYIHYNYGAPDPACAPQTLLGTMPNVGIFEVNLHTIGYASLDANMEGYADHSCSGQQTRLIEGVTYPVSILTGTIFNENVRVWIDYDNNTNFDPVTELAFSSDDQFIYHSGAITVPTGTPHDVPIRMRVASSADLLTPLTPCTDIMNGQAEDYTITVTSSQVPPVSDFEEEHIGNCDGEIQFTDKSVNQAAGWQWDFGDSTTSSTPNPIKVYDLPGIYDVTLITNNSFGSDTVHKSVNVVFTHADFEIVPNPAVVGTEVSFVNRGSGYNIVNWNLGDGNASADKHTTHTYSATGSYNVRLTVEHEQKGCMDFLVQALQIVNATGVGSPELGGYVNVFPNPTTGLCYISGLDNIEGSNHVEILNITGQSMHRQQLVPGSAANHTLDLSDLAKGVYFVKITGEARIIYRKIELH